jgi:hypothetical protein
VIYRANNKIGATGQALISVFYGSNFKETHNLATRDLIKKVIETSAGNYAVSFNESSGYDMVLPHNITSASSELEM